MPGYIPSTTRLEERYIPRYLLQLACSESLSIPPRTSNSNEPPSASAAVTHHLALALWVRRLGLTSPASMFTSARVITFRIRNTLHGRVRLGPSYLNSSRQCQVSPRVAFSESENIPSFHPTFPEKQFGSFRRKYDTPKWGTEVSWKDLFFLSCNVQTAQFCKPL